MNLIGGNGLRVHFPKNKPCRAGTKIYNKLESSEFIPMNEASYTTSIAYKTDALKRKKQLQINFQKIKKLQKRKRKEKRKTII